MKIRIAITDCRISDEMIRQLQIHGFRVITLPPYSKLSDAVASHTDMLIHRLGDEYISYADYCEEASYIFTDISLLLSKGGARLSFCADEVGSDYPNDCRLNALRMGNKLFLKTDSASEYLLSAAKRAGLDIVHTNQGYPACTVLKLNDSAAITADHGMAKILGKHGIDVTIIENTGIELPPHEYGFIGGAGAVYDGALYFFGNPELHTSYDKISAAAENANLKIVPLAKTPLRDLGGIIFADGNID